MVRNHSVTQNHFIDYAHANATPLFFRLYIAHGLLPIMIFVMNFYIKQALAKIHCMSDMLMLKLTLV